MSQSPQERPPVSPSPSPSITLTTWFLRSHSWPSPNVGSGFSTHFFRAAWLPPMTEAVATGSRKIRACQEIGLSLRTLQRWTEAEVVQADARTTSVRPTPRNALSEVERQAIVTLCNSPEYAHLPPSQIVPRLADQERYLASEATFYRVLRAAMGDFRQVRDTEHPGSTMRTPTIHRRLPGTLHWGLCRIGGRLALPLQSRRALETCRQSRTTPGYIPESPC